VKFYVAQHSSELALDAVNEIAADESQGDFNMIVGLRLLTQHGITPEQCVGGVVIDKHEQMQLVNKKDLADLTEAAKLSVGRDRLNNQLFLRLRTEKESNANLQKEVAELKVQLQSGDNRVVATKAKTGKKKPNKKSSKSRVDFSTAPGLDDAFPQPSTQDDSLLSTEMLALEQEKEVDAPLVHPEPIVPPSPVPPVIADAAQSTQPPSPLTILSEEMQDLRAEFASKYAVLQSAFDDLLDKLEEQRAAMKTLTELVTRGEKQK